MKTWGILKSPTNFTRIQFVPGDIITQIRSRTKADHKVRFKTGIRTFALHLESLVEVSGLNNRAGHGQGKISAARKDN